MALKDLLKATTYDRYTQDGRDKLNEALAEDVKYKTGDISQKTGLQKQPDGSWAPPKGSSAAKHQKAMEGAKKVGIVNKVPAGWKKAEGVTTTPNGYVAITNGGSRFPKEGQAKREVKFIKQEDFEKGNATEGLESKSTEELTNLFNELATKSVREKSPENSAARDRVYKELKRRQKENQPKAKFDEYGLPDNETISMKEEFLKKEKVADPNKLTNAEFNALAKKLDNELGIGNMELAQELLVTPSENKPVEKDIRSEFNITREEHDQDAMESNAKLYPELQPLVKQRAPFVQKRIAAYTKLRDNPSNPKARADFVDASNAIAQIDADIDRAYKKATGENEGNSYWGTRAKNERTATLVDWLDDWDQNPDEKNEEAYKEIEKELASRGVKRENRAAAKEADNRERNEFYRRAYDAAPRQLTGDCKIRVRKA